MKTEVMSLVTHELRTPLTAIQGMSEVLAQFDVEPDRRREMHAAINEEAKRLARMIDEYLDITRLEAGARPLRKTPLRVDALVERVLLLLDPLASSRGTEINEILARTCRWSWRTPTCSLRRSQMSSPTPSSTVRGE